MAKLKVKALLTKLVNSSEFVVEEHSKAVSMSGSSTFNGAITIGKNGYKPIGIAGWYISQSTSMAYLTQVYIENDTTARLFGKNTYTASLTITMGVFVLYQKLGGVLNRIVSTIAHFGRGCAVC